MKLRNIKELLRRAHRDEQGAEGLEKLLIIGLIVLPLVGVLIYFRGQIAEWASSAFDKVKTDADNQNLPGGS